MIRGRESGFLAARTSAFPIRAASGRPGVARAAVFSETLMKTPQRILALLFPMLLVPALRAAEIRVGLFGLTVPGLALQGEVGQQIGFLSAAGAWTLNFVIMLGAAVAYGQRERFRAWVGAKLGRKGASAR